MAKVAIIGLGYVGLTLAVAMARAGHQIYGIEKSNDIVSDLKRGEVHFYEPGLKEIFKNCLNNGLEIFTPNDISSGEFFDFIFITIGTPITEDKQAVLDHLYSAVAECLKLMTRDCILILRSTLPIGITTKIKQQLTLELGYECVTAFCPERTQEGNALQELRTLPQIIGTSFPKARPKIAELFSSLGVEVVQCDSPEEAEAIKLFCNTYRDLMLGMGNMFYNIAREHGLDGISIIDKANFQYPRSNIARPGVVGGMCLTKDPYILASTIKDKELYNAVNIGRQQSNTLTLQIKEFIRRKIAAVPGNVLISGLAFKGVPETSDLRDSAGVEIARDMLEQFGTDKVDVHDFVASQEDIKKNLNVDGMSLEDIKKAKKTYDGIAILNNHPQYSSPTFNWFLNNNLVHHSWIFDGWSILDTQPMVNIDAAYYDLRNMA